MLGAVEHELPTLNSHEIIFELFRPIRDHIPQRHNASGQTDRRTTCRVNSTLCV